MSKLHKDPIGTAEKAAKEISKITKKGKHDVALIMGSGWVSAAEALGTPTHEFAVTDLPGFSCSYSYWAWWKSTLLRFRKLCKSFSLSG